MVLIPAKASPFDVWASRGHCGSSAGAAGNLHGKTQAAFVITMTRPRTRLSRQIDAAFAEAYRCTGVLLYIPP